MGDKNHNYWLTSEDADAVSVRALLQQWLKAGLASRNYPSDEAYLNCESSMRRSVETHNLKWEQV